jgi:hypothetical protein
MIPLSLYLSHLVVAERMPRLIWEAMGGNAFGPRESDTMITEKLTAMQRGGMAAQREMMLAGMQSGMAAMRGQPAEAARVLMAAPARVTKAALQPAARTVSANLKRLKKR